MTTITNKLSSEWLLRPLRKTHLIVLIAILFSIGFVSAINNIQLLLIAGVVSIVGVLLLTNDARIRFLSIIAVIPVLKSTTSTVGFDYKDYIGGLIFTFGFFETLFRRRLVSRLPLSPSPFYTGCLLFLAWAAGIGLLNIFMGNVTLDRWFRELLSLSPLLLLPIYFVEILESDNKGWHILLLSVVMLWIAIFILEVLKIRSNIIQAEYLYQIGVARFDNIIGGFMVFLVLSAAMSLPKKKKQLVIAFFFALVCLILAFMRTAWVGTLLGLPFIFMLGNKSERRNGYKFILWISITGAILLVLGYFFVPMIRFGLLYTANKFFGATVGVKSDVSLYNRFVEWRAVGEAIFKAPLTGHGIGSVYVDYDWLLGITKMFHYTHNGFLGILLKSGIVGLILILIPYIGYTLRGMGYFFSDYLTLHERIYLRAGLVLMVFLTFVSFTSNIFFEPSNSLHLALFWCYCIYLERAVHERKTSDLWLKGGERRAV